MKLQEFALLAAAAFLSVPSAPALTVSASHNEYYREDAYLSASGFSFFTVRRQVRQSSSSSVRIYLTPAEKLMLGSSAPSVSLGGATFGVRRAYGDGWLYTGQPLDFMRSGGDGDFSNKRLSRSTGISVGPASGNITFSLTHSSVTNGVPGVVPADSLPQHIVVDDDRMSGSGARRFPTIIPVAPSRSVVVRAPAIDARFHYRTAPLGIGANGNIAPADASDGNGGWRRRVALQPGANIVSAAGAGALDAGVRVFYDTLGGLHSAVLEDSFGNFAGVLALNISTTVDPNANSAAFKSLSAKAVLDGNTFHFKSTSLGAMASRPGPGGVSAQMNLNRGPDGSLTGTFSFSGETFSIRGGRSISDKRYRPAPVAGRFTCHFAPTPMSGPNAGSAIAHIIVRTDGGARIAGLMPDGPPFSAGGQLIEETTLPFAGKFGRSDAGGIFTGEAILNIAPLGATTVAGQTSIQAGQAAAETRQIQGGSFTPGDRKAGTNSFDLPVGAKPQLAVDFAPPQPANTFALTLSGPSKLEPAAGEQRIRLSSANRLGFLSGKVADPATGGLLKFKTIALQGISGLHGAGHVKTAAGSAALRIENGPAAP